MTKPQMTTPYKANQPDGNGRWFITKDFPTEELAELHVIIQAIEYGRSSNDSKR